MKLRSLYMRKLEKNCCKHSFQRYLIHKFQRRLWNSTSVAFAEISHHVQKSCCIECLKSVIRCWRFRVVRYTVKRIFLTEFSFIFSENYPKNDVLQTSFWFRTLFCRVLCYKIWPKLRSCDQSYNKYRKKRDFRKFWVGKRNNMNYCCLIFQKAIIQKRKKDSHFLRVYFPVAEGGPMSMTSPYMGRVELPASVCLMHRNIYALECSAEAIYSFGWALESINIF